MKLISTILLLLIAAFGITFAILNSEPVSLNYYFGVYKISLSLLLVTTLTLGLIIGFLLSTPSLFRLKRGNAKLKSKMKQVEKEVDNLRYMPIKDDR